MEVLTMWLSPAHARWLGHLYHAASERQPLSEYAKAQQLSLAQLLSWERQLAAQGVAVPRRRRPARFVAVELGT
jgi:transposase